MMCAVIVVAFRGRFSLIAYSVWTFVNFPMATTTDMICRASSREGARQRASNPVNEHEIKQEIRTIYLRFVDRKIYATEHG